MPFSSSSNPYPYVVILLGMRFRHYAVSDVQCLSLDNIGTLNNDSKPTNRMKVETAVGPEVANNLEGLAVLRLRRHIRPRNRSNFGSPMTLMTPGSPLQQPT
ncbi:hypothetical protein RSOL_177260, partial [Rhizoctonia solani AG-3 Rhs1AP]